MNVAIIKYNAGNIRSVYFALERLGIQAIITDEPEQIRAADKVIFPGVGEASTAMQYLRSKALDTLIVQLDQPVLGICLGMQLMGAYSDEGNTHCLGIFDYQIKKFSNVPKIPHMGWNILKSMRGDLFQGVHETEAYVYFVHSYYCENEANATALCRYGIDFSASVQKDNFYATQFHPEKSGDIGEQILSNFIAL